MYREKSNYYFGIKPSEGVMMDLLEYPVKSSQAVPKL